MMNSKWFGWCIVVGKDFVLIKVSFRTLTKCNRLKGKLWTNNFWPGESLPTIFLVWPFCKCSRFNINGNRCRQSKCSTESSYCVYWSPLSPDSDSVSSNDRCQINLCRPSLNSKRPCCTSPPYAWSDSTDIPTLGTSSGRRLAPAFASQRIYLSCTLPQYLNTFDRNHLTKNRILDASQNHLVV